jgi:glycosyltransferase involved in cell wall biosynthesis
MNILINLISIKKGGGQQVASNLINQIVNERGLSLVFLATEDTYVCKLLTERNAAVIVVESDKLSRFLFQRLKLSQIVKDNNIDVIYTMFGPGLHCKGVQSVTGCAYSNLFFPEVDFWSGYSILQRIKLKLIDTYRLKSTLKSDAIVFENEAMRKRATELFKYPVNQTTLILPSVSEYKTIKDIAFDEVLKKINNKNFNIVLLTGWHKNKNIEILPFILVELKKQGYTDVSFVVTISENHPNSQKLRNIAEEFNVFDNIVFLDSVTPHNIPVLFEHIDGVGLFSLLESFSNNIIEAWHFEKPLFISDEEWSRSICKNAAVYVDRNKSKDIADKIINYRADLNFQEELKILTNKILSKYPTPKEKVSLQLEFIKKVYDERSN